MGLDGVELVMAVEDTFGIAISDAAAAEMITPALLIEHVQREVCASTERRVCISQRAFYQVRSSLVEVTGVRRSSIKLKTPIKKLFPKSERVELWQNFRESSLLLNLPDLRFGRGLIFFPTCIQDLVSHAISQRAAELSDERSWTAQEVRQVVRLIITEQLGIKKFSDDDEFVRDLGVD